MIVIQVEGFAEAIELLENVNIPDQLGETLDKVLVGMARSAAAHTPVDTGAMRNSWNTYRHDLRGSVFIDPKAVNPRSSVPVTDYAEIVAEREGIIDIALKTGVRLASLEDFKWEE